MLENSVLFIPFQSLPDQKDLGWIQRKSTSGTKKLRALFWLACGAAGPRIAYSVDIRYKQGLKGLCAGYVLVCPNLSRLINISGSF